MSRLTELLTRLEASDPALGRDIAREVDVLANRLPFGLSFERHVPETVALPTARVRRGNKVLIKDPDNPSSVSSSELWLVISVKQKKRILMAELVNLGNPSAPAVHCAVDDLVVVAEFRDAIYPGLRATDQVKHDEAKPFHTVINGENFHVLQTLAFSYKGRVDCIYIDPPYNTRDRDWKYNNDYVDSDDRYRHSKWLAMMERRLKLAKSLLREDTSVLIVTIDEKEYLRLGLLLEQIFPECRIQMISSLINPASSPRQKQFGRSDEYLFFVFRGDAAPNAVPLSSEWISSRGRTFKGEIRWDLVMQSGPSSQREDSPNGFYPIYVDPDGPRIHSVGEALPRDAKRSEEVPEPGLTAVWPIRRDGTEGRWRMRAATLRDRLPQGWVRLGGNVKNGYTLYYLPPAEIAKIDSGIYEVTGKRPDGSLVTGLATSDAHLGVPTTQWRSASHDATQYGSRLLGTFIPGRKFPFPKSLYAVEDALRFVLAEKPEALVLDFFAGSGTTTHALARLNAEDGGRRRSICVTNNEVSPDEGAQLARAGLRPGDVDWEKFGICKYVTEPRIKSAFTGVTPEGATMRGKYKFGAKRLYSDGLPENVRFFDLTYEDPEVVNHGLGFGAIAPLLWLTAGAEGGIIEEVTDDFAVTDRYAVLFDVDSVAPFLAAVTASPELECVFIATDEEPQFQIIDRQMPAGLKSLRLYSTYLEHFRLRAGV